MPKNTETKNKDYIGEALDFLKDMVIIVVVVLVIRTFFAMPFQINGQSMYDSYYDKEFILVDRLSYRDIPFMWPIQEIERGDVVVFDPKLWGKRKYYIKRIIGLPWDQVKIEEGKVYLKTPTDTDFRELPEPYLSEENAGKTYVRGVNDIMLYEVPKDHYMLFGDNRLHSSDSRTCFQSCATGTPYIVKDQIVGKMFFDAGYFNFKTFSFDHPVLGISTKPRFLSSPREFQY